VEAAGYRHAWFDGLNRWFVAEEQAGLIERLALPPNVFDDFIPAQLHALSARVGSADFDAAEARRGAEAARREAEEARLAEAKRRAVMAEAALRAVQASTSWRLTAPLRALRGG
jgi:hypothetical protein